MAAATSPPPVDLKLARPQHRAYCQALSELGVEVVTLPEDPARPDSVFVQDTAVIVAGRVIVCWPGAPSRRGEEVAVAGLLADRGLPTVRIQPPGTLEGRDVLVTERGVFVGRSARTNAQGVAQLRRILQPAGTKQFAKSSLHFPFASKGLSRGVRAPSGGCLTLKTGRGRPLLAVGGTPLCSSRKVSGTYGDLLASPR